MDLIATHVVVGKLARVMPLWASNGLLMGGVHRMEIALELALSRRMTSRRLLIEYMVNRHATLSPEEVAAVVLGVARGARYLGQLHVSLKR